MSLSAQNETVKSNNADSLKIERKYGLRIGGDIGKLIRTAIDDEYTGFEIAADYRLKKNIYLAGEIGFDEKDNVTDYLDVTTSGSYFKAGIDYNSYQNWLDMDNMIYFGFRVGASSFNHTLNSFKTYNTSQYWGDQFASNTSEKFEGLTAIWGEIILGLKAELFNNLYMGLNVQLKFLANENQPDNFQNIYIPGFHKTFDSSRIGVGYGYTIAYRIPLYKSHR